MGNQKLYIEEGQTMQWTEEKGQREDDPKNTTEKTED